MKEVDMYTDGACKGNPGAGGFCCILRYKGKEKLVSGGEANTTNNRMELCAVISGLEILREPCEVTVYSDSKYVVDAMKLGWARGWKEKGWKKSDGKTALNTDLWERLLSLSEMHRLRFVWVKGHDGHEYNERCDREAVAQAEKFT
ncbi:MAG TPA: ribonuclease HI [Clostridiales bacterium]|nr:ribonuclease HI [Candidatus Apopatosoma intestinale]CCZ21156.1 ribonuclease HI [Candidatus Apopatosoma intestinale]HBO65974.1 ribonuclease HI [Candidatus Apopatosoma intestinale]